MLAGLLVTVQLVTTIVHSVDWYAWLGGRGDGSLSEGGSPMKSDDQTLQSRYAWQAGQQWRARTERRTETRSSTKDYADAQDDAVNKRACKSMEGKELAPRLQPSSEQPFGEPDGKPILHGVN